jgi:hypothetical protein
MSIPRDELLKPSLSLTHTTRAPYSTTTTFLTAFFGGPLAIIGITGLNAWRLGRLRRDVVPLLIVLVAYLGLVWSLALTEWGTAFQASLLEMIGLKSMFNIYRLVALIMCGMGYLLHRNEQRSAELLGMVRPDNWIAALAFIGAGILAMPLWLPS